MCARKFSTGITQHELRIPDDTLCLNATEQLDRFKLTNLNLQFNFKKRIQILEIYIISVQILFPGVS